MKSDLEHVMERALEKHRNAVHKAIDALVKVKIAPARSVPEVDLALHQLLGAGYGEYIEHAIKREEANTNVCKHDEMRAMQHTNHGMVFLYRCTKCGAERTEPCLPS